MSILRWELVDSGFGIRAEHPAAHDGGSPLYYLAEQVSDYEWLVEFDGIGVHQGPLLECLQAAEKDAQP